jgi:hypothetical protein
MKNSSFLVTLAIGSALGAVLTKLCLDTLDSGEEAQLITQNFVDTQGWLTRGVPLVSFALLFIQARAYKQNRAPGGFFVLCWLYFALFTAIDYVWLSDVVFRHTKSTGTWEGGFNALGILGAALIPAFGLACGAGYVVARSQRLRSAD